MSKQTYKGKFNYFGEVIEIHCRAHNQESAFTIMCTKVAAQVKMTSYNIRNYFYNTNRYEISAVKKSSEK